LFWQTGLIFYRWVGLLIGSKTSQWKVRVAFVRWFLKINATFSLVGAVEAEKMFTVRQDLAFQFLVCYRK
jgi:hypothetical protein